MATTINPCPSLTGPQGTYLKLDPLDGNAFVDIGLGEGVDWKPSGALTDITALSSEQALLWCRQNNLTAAHRNPLIESLPQDYFERVHPRTEPWPLVKSELAGPKSQKKDVVFTRLRSPHDSRFLQVGVEFTRPDGKKQIPITLAGFEEDETPTDLDLKPFRWGGFIHAGDDVVSMRYVFDQEDVAQEALSFRISEKALHESLSYFLNTKALPVKSDELLDLAAKLFCGWQFPSDHILQDGRAFRRVYTIVGESVQNEETSQTGIQARKIMKGISSLADVTTTKLVEGELGQDGDYRFTIFRPGLREYGPKLVLIGDLRRLVASLLVNQAEPLTEQRLTPDNLFAGIQTANAATGRMRFPKR